MKPRNEICIWTDENRLKMSALTIQTILTTILQQKAITSSVN